jgi:hypothetical protein
VDEKRPKKQPSPTKGLRLVRVVMVAIKRSW